MEIKNRCYGKGSIFMPRRGRLPADEKIRIVETYLAGEIGVSEFQQKYGIKNQTLYDWVRLYKLLGTAGLCATERNRKYAPELKRQAVEEYLSGLASLRELCTKYDISNKSMLQHWIKRYNSHEDFKQPNSGGCNQHDKRARNDTGGTHRDGQSLHSQ